MQHLSISIVHFFWHSNCFLQIVEIAQKILAKIRVRLAHIKNFFLDFRKYK